MKYCGHEVYSNTPESESNDPTSLLKTSKERGLEPFLKEKKHIKPPFILSKCFETTEYPLLLIVFRCTALGLTFLETEKANLLKPGLSKGFFNTKSIKCSELCLLPEVKSCPNSFLCILLLLGNIIDKIFNL